MSDAAGTTETGSTEGGGGAWNVRAWGTMVGVALALLPMLVRLQSPMDLLPYWEGDPLNQEAVLIGISPPASLMGDLVSLIGAALLFACGARRRLWALAPLALAGIGAWACLWHMPGRGYDVKSVVTGGAWISGVGVATALWAAGKDRRVRLVAFALIAGVVGLLAAKGVYQVAVEHPATVEAFRRDRDAIFARNGWQADSAMAKAYERRLVQSEASGWFGFANVYASFAALGVAVFGVSLIGLILKRRDDAEDEEDEGISKAAKVICGLGLALSCAALVMAGAKGGYAVAALGVGVGLVLLLLRRRSETGRPALAGWSWIVGPVVVVLPLAAVVARGLVGDRIGELSLLFRWFYMQGAARIFGENWQHGVGPDGFQAAYALAKNPLSPEDVTSPHSLMWDWAACLGVGGLAWAVWLVWLSTRLGPAAVRSNGRAASEANGDTRVMMRLVCVIAALCAMVAIPMQYAALLPEEALGVRIGGLVVWCVLSCGFLAATRVWSGWPAALAGGAVVLLAHTQIEITGVWMQSCGLLLAVIALAASGCGGSTDERQARSGIGFAVGGVVACIGAAFMLLGPSYTLVVGEAKLLRAYMLLEPVRKGREQLALAVRDRSPQAPAIAHKLRQTEPGQITQAVRMLPGSWPSSRNASQMSLQLAHAYRTDTATPDHDARSQAWAVYAVSLVMPGQDNALDQLLDKPAIGGTEAATAFARLAAAPTDELDTRTAAWVATVSIASADAVIGPSQAAWLELAAAHLQRAHATDPYNPAHALRLMDVYERLGRTDDARTAAKETLKADAFQRYDRTVRGLNDRDRARAERIAGGAGASGTQGGGVSPGAR